MNYVAFENTHQTDVVGLFYVLFYVFLRYQGDLLSSEANTLFFFLNNVLQLIKRQINDLYNKFD